MGADGIGHRILSIEPNHISRQGVQAKGKERSKKPKPKPLLGRIDGGCLRWLRDDNKRISAQPTDRTTTGKRSHGWRRRASRKRPEEQTPLMRYVHNTMFWIQPLKMNVCFDCFAKIMKNPALTGNLRNIHALTYVRRLFLFCCPIIYSYLCSRQIGGTASR
ncbi:MAG: hypothetical protein SO365_05390, partial [Prevotella sp.]|nr:hypothetical protein [Prevotella sp.]